MNTPNNKRRRESQRKLERAFVALLQKTELDRLTVTDVCREAAVNRTTFYANYQDIPALAEAVKERMVTEVIGLYREEWCAGHSSHDFLPLFRHIRDNQLFYKTYFALCTDGQLGFFGYDTAEAERRFGNSHIDYHIEFFGHGLNAVIRKWLRGGCRETPEEINAILEAEYRRT